MILMKTKVTELILLSRKLKRAKNRSRVLIMRTKIINDGVFVF